jgi:ATP-binding cassette subfamily B protein
MKKILMYLKPYKVFTILAPVMMLLEVFMDLLQPVFMQRIIDVGIADGDMQYVLSKLYLMLGVAFVGMIGGLGCSYFSAKAAINAGTDIRNDLFEKVQSFSFGNIDRIETGNLITRLTNDVVQVQRVMMMLMRIMVRAPLQIIGSFIMAFIISPKLSLILLVIVPILVLTLIVIVKKGYPIFTLVQGRLDQVNTVMQENLAGIRVVKAFVRREFEKNRFARANDSLKEMTVKVSRIMALLSPIVMLLLNAGVIAVIWFGSIEVNSGRLKVGMVLAFVNYLLQLLSSLMMVANLIMMYSRAQASATRITEVLETLPDISENKSAIAVKRLQGNIEFNKVNFSYNKEEDKPVLTDISFTVNQGEKLAILGSTGSGKTTLVNLIPRFYALDSGSITIDGINIQDMTSQSLRENIAMVLQQTVLFSGTIRENIMYGKPDASMEEVIEAAECVQADSFIRAFEKGYETVLGQKGVNLSGGQKQRIAIARALITKPAILILDDSTSAVDVTTEARIQDELDRNLGDTTVILVAQRISSVLDADKILVLDEGEIVACGNHDDLIQSSEIYRDIYVSQLGEEVLIHV